MRERLKILFAFVCTCTCVLLLWWHMLCHYQSSSSSKIFAARRWEKDSYHVLGGVTSLAKEHSHRHLGTTTNSLFQRGSKQRRIESLLFPFLCRDKGKVGVMRCLDRWQMTMMDDDVIKRQKTTMEIISLVHPQYHRITCDFHHGSEGKSYDIVKSQSKIFA